ncbi:glycosyltransferase [Stieleria varia]|uniref:D-inositol 3-phosphate glycosyltransferase n=1 Tax=Stieleria varia TaxID=2528005 RepID=A0A5C6B236_9BACT|nr:glycosyltransferase [Stieleria varia]TWU06193.1 D-inositol 3-phosphate glycosyltransferase [Stieleria varia]
MFDSTCQADKPIRVGYVVKRYPRYSETFIVNEILAHEAVGLPIEIFSVRPPVDTHFQDIISQVRAPVHYLPTNLSKSSDFWQLIGDASKRHSFLASRLSKVIGHNPAVVTAAIAMADQATKTGITHFHAHFATSAADIAWLASQLTEIPFTLTAHAKDIFHEDVDHAALVQKLQAAHATITVSDFNVDFLQQNFGDAADRVERIYNGLNLNHFPFSSPRNREPVVLAVGRLVEKKGFDVLIDACSILAERNVSFRTCIIGDGPLMPDLRRHAETSMPDNQIEFLGPQRQEVVKTALRGAAVFAAPCVEGSDGNRDGLPTVLLESMAIGTPCVSTPVTGIPEAIMNDETGLLVPQRDPTKLADALQRLLRDGELRVRLAEAARQHIERNFDIHRNTAKQRRLFGSSIHDSPHAADRLVSAGVA